MLYSINSFSKKKLVQPKKKMAVPRVSAGLTPCFIESLNGKLYF